MKIELSIPELKYIRMSVNMACHCHNKTRPDMNVYQIEKLIDKLEIPIIDKQQDIDPSLLIESYLITIKENQSESTNKEH